HMLDLAADHDLGGSEMDIDAAIVLERLGDTALLLHPGKLQQEIGVEEVPAELAVRDGLEAEGFLPLDQLCDRLVLDRAQLLIGNGSSGAVGARLDYGTRSQERADMIGAGRQL